MIIVAGFTLLASNSDAVAHAHHRTTPRAHRAINQCVCSYFTVQLAATVVRAYNASRYPSSSLITLVQYADRSMDTQDPVDNDVSGEMHSGDLVVVTNHGIYWIDATTRGGLLSGEWPIGRGRAGARFSNVVGTHQWAPNLLLPGSNGTNAAGDEGDEGLGIRVVPQGGSDGSTVTGKGVFDPHGAVSLSFTGQRGHEHIFQYTGFLTQEYNGTSVMIDGSGDTSEMKYVITYRFDDATDTGRMKVGVAGKQFVSDQYANSIRVSLTPENTSGNCVDHFVHCIHLSVFDIGDDLQFIPTSQTSADLYAISSDDTLSNFSPPGCPPGGSHASQTFVALCTSTPAGDIDFIQEPALLPTTVPAGDETEFCSSDCRRSLTYIHPPGFTLPARDAAVYNRILDVIAVETQYFNTDDPTQTWYDDRTIHTAEKQMMESVYAPPSRRK